MSSEAAQHRTKAIEAVETAIKELSEIVVNRCEGSSQYRDDVKKPFFQLIDLLDYLNE